MDGLPASFPLSTAAEFIKFSDERSWLANRDEVPNPEERIRYSQQLFERQQFVIWARSDPEFRPILNGLLEKPCTSDRPPGIPLELLVEAAAVSIGLPVVCHAMLSHAHRLKQGSAENFAISESRYHAIGQLTLKLQKELATGECPEFCV